jgi:tetratricopeptide (TPR) repeat protein
LSAFAANKKANNLGFLFLFLLVAFLLYGKTFNYAWTFDDYPVIVENTDIRSISNFFENKYLGRPLREITYLLDYYFFDLNPKGYHFQNILWHAANGFLVFLLAKSLRFSQLYSSFAALLFIVHPICVEVVAQTSHRKDSLVLFFGLLFLLILSRYISEKNSKGFFVVSVSITLALAFLAKENFIAIPFVGLAYVLIFTQNKLQFFSSKKFLTLFALLFFGLVIGRAVYLFFDPSFEKQIYSAFLKMADSSSVSLSAYYLTVFKSQVFMFIKWIWPVGLAPEYTFSIPKTISDPWVVADLLLVVLWLVVLWKSWARFPVVSFLLLFLLFAWLPISNIFGHYSYFAADRYIYFPSAPLALLTMRGISQISSPKLAKFFSLILIFTAAYLSFNQISIWQKPSTLTNQIVKVNPLSLEGKIGKASDFLDSGDYDVALKLFKELQVEYPLDSKIYKNLAMTFFKLGDVDSAIFYAEKGLMLNSSDPAALSNLGAFYEMSGFQEKAVVVLKKAYQLNPYDQRYANNLGKLYEGLGQLDHAEDLYRDAIKRLPTYSLGHYNLGVVLYRTGQKEEALQAFSKASRLNTEDFDALFNWGVTAAELGQYDEARKIIAKIRPVDVGRANELAKIIADSERSQPDNR